MLNKYIKKNNKIKLKKKGGKKGRPHGAWETLNSCTWSRSTTHLNRKAGKLVLFLKKKRN